MEEVFMKIDSKWIAKLSGVSRSTVSRVINDYPDISPATKEKYGKLLKRMDIIQIFQPKN